MLGPAEHGEGLPGENRIRGAAPGLDRRPSGLDTLLGEETAALRDVERQIADYMVGLGDRDLIESNGRLGIHDHRSSGYHHRKRVGTDTNVALCAHRNL